MKHIKIVPMAAEHLNDVAALELACFSRPWSRSIILLAAPLVRTLLPV